MVHHCKTGILGASNRDCDDIVIVMLRYVLVRKWAKLGNCRFGVLPLFVHLLSYSDLRFGPQLWNILTNINRLTLQNSKNKRCDLDFVFGLPLPQNDPLFSGYDPICCFVNNFKVCHLYLHRITRIFVNIYWNWLLVSIQRNSCVLSLILFWWYEPHPVLAHLSTLQPGAQVRLVQVYSIFCTSLCILYISTWIRHMYKI